MKSFYYMIKGKQYQSWNEAYGWGFPPIFSGKVEAEDRKAARAQIDELYGKQFPMRVLQKDMDKNEFLLDIRELNSSDYYTEGLFDVVECKNCNNKFKRIDKYNDTNNKCKDSDHCSQECQDETRREQFDEWSLSNAKSNFGGAVIYKITDKLNGKCYIGQTIRPFTLRWWEHLQTWIPVERLSDFSFEIMEVIEDTSKLNEREQFYIDKFDSILNGYNLMNAKRR